MSKGGICAPSNNRSGAVDPSAHGLAFGMGQYHGCRRNRPSRGHTHRWACFSLGYGEREARITPQMASNQLEPFRLISQFFWLICLGVSLINYIVARRRIAPGPNSEDAIRYLDWMSFAGAVPWGLMGVGQISGFTPTVWYYFRPQDLNPFVVLWLA